MLSELNCRGTAESFADSHNFFFITQTYEKAAIHIMHNTQTELKSAIVFLNACSYGLLPLATEVTTHLHLVPYGFSRFQVNFESRKRNPKIRELDRPPYRPFLMSKLFLAGQQTSFSKAHTLSRSPITAYHLHIIQTLPLSLLESHIYDVCYLHCRNDRALSSIGNHESLQSG